MSASERRTWAGGVRELVAEQDTEIKGEEVTGDWRNYMLMSFMIVLHTVC